MKGPRHADPTSGDITQDDGESFASRWSRRKLEGDGEDAPEAVKAPAPAEESTTERVLTDADLPAPESLSDGADFSGFLSPGVSEALRQKALKRLFSSAQFNVVDGLDDYAEDFTQFAALGEVVTHEMRRMLKASLEEQTSDEPSEPADEDSPETCAPTDLNQSIDDQAEKESDV